MSTATVTHSRMASTVHSSALRTIEKREDVAEGRVPVLLPDMFVSFLAQKPRINPHYEKIKIESEAWINDQCDFDDRMRRRIRATDFSFFCSVSAPEAHPEELRTMCDWGNWVFPWDDMFDNGSLRQSPEKAQQMMESLLSTMSGSGSLTPKTPLVKVHDSVWHRIKEASPAGVQRRFYRAMTSYCSGALEHVSRESHAAIPSIHEQLVIRRRSSGVTPLFALIEYAHRLDLPDKVFEHSSLKEIERIGTDIVLLQNDMLSYCKEEAEGVNHNLVAICRLNGMPAQKAFDHINTLLRDCYRDWHLALAILPQWGEKIDSQVYSYIRGVQDVVLANLNWSFKSRRYLGESHDVVRQTRQITVMPQPQGQIRAKEFRPSTWLPQAPMTQLCGALCLLATLIASLGLSFSIIQLEPVFNTRR